MAGGARPGTECLQKNRRRLDRGTSCLQRSPRPGSNGLADESWSFSKTVSEYAAGVGAFFDRTTEAAGGHARSAVLSIADLIPIKPDSPVSTALLKHYVERSGSPYEIDPVPAEWQDWIVKTTRGRLGKHRGLNPYNAGLYDLRNSLGHFDVQIKAGEDGTKTYLISDIYVFGATKNDRMQRGRHGFPLGELTTWQVDALKRALPEDAYRNPGGFTERWEIKTVGKETIIYIPQQYLARHGKPFQVTGRFSR